MFGAPMAASGTAPAMDQGIMGAMTTTVFSRSRAKEDFSGLVFPAQLAGELEGKSLVAGDGGSDNGSQ